MVTRDTGRRSRLPPAVVDRSLLPRHHRGPGRYRRRATVAGSIPILGQPRGRLLRGGGPGQLRYGVPAVLVVLHYHRVRSSGESEIHGGTGRALVDPPVDDQLTIYEQAHT